MNKAGSSESYGSSLDYDFESFGGESRDRVLRRHLSLLEELSEKQESEPLLLVGHGMGLNTLLAHFKKPPLHRGEYAFIDYLG